MDWSPPSPPQILYQSQEPWTGAVAGQRRTFEQISDGTEPQGRQNGIPPPVHAPRYDPGQPGFFPPDENMGTIPRLAYRCGFCALYFGGFVLGQIGQGVGYAGVAIKRRIVAAARARSTGSPRNPETPRQRRRRNMYLTPRQMYEQRSLRSIRIRDMPGRYPSLPQSCYTNADPYGQPTERTDMSEAPWISEIQDAYCGETFDGMPASIHDSPLALKKKTTGSTITSDDCLTQEVDVSPLENTDLALQSDSAPFVSTLDEDLDQAASTTSSSNHLTQEVDTIPSGTTELALQNDDAPLISTLDEDLEQEKKRKEALEAIAVKPLEAAPTAPALFWDSSDSGDLSDFDEDFEDETPSSGTYDPSTDPSLAIVAEARELEEWEIDLMEGDFPFTPIRNYWKPPPPPCPPYKSAVDKESHAEKPTTATDNVQEKTEDSMVAGDEVEIREEENMLNGFDAAEDIEMSSSPLITTLIVASSKERSATALEAIKEVDIESDVRDKMDESAACTESSDNSRSSVLAASISPPLQHNLSSAVRQQPANQSHVLPRGHVPNLMANLAYYFGHRPSGSAQQTPPPRAHNASSRTRKTVGFYESPKTGRPVTRTKRFVIGETIDHPSPISSHDESSFLNDDGSQPGQEPRTAAEDQIALDSQLQPLQPTIPSESGLISPVLGEVSFESTESSGNNAEVSRNEDVEMSEAPAENNEGDVGSAEDIVNYMVEQTRSQLHNTSEEKEEDCLDEAEGTGNEAQNGASEKEEDHLGEDEGHNNGDQDNGSGKEEDNLGGDNGSGDGEKNNTPNQGEDHLGEDNGSTEEEKDDTSQKKEDSAGNNERTDQDESMKETEDLQPLQDEHRAEGDNRDGEPSSEGNGPPATPRTGKLSTRTGGKKMKRKDLSGALDDLSITQEVNVSPRRASARRRSLAEKEAQEKAAREKKEAEEKARREKEEAERLAQLEREAEEQRRKLGGRQFTKEPAVQPLSAEWNRKINEAMSKAPSTNIATTSSGNSITRRSMGMVLPQRDDDPSGWLNDEIIAGYLQAVIDHGNARAHLKRGDTPKFHAFSSFFYSNLKKPGGYENVRRWARRAKVGGTDLFKVEWVFIPVNVGGNHWTLAVVSPTRKTIEYFDSMHGSASQIINNIRAWLAGELGTAYVADEWTVRDDDQGRYAGRGKGPTQTNGSDCGVFTVTTAKLISLGIEPLAFSPRDTPLQRRRIVAELMNGGFIGEFEPKFEFL